MSNSDDNSSPGQWELFDAAPCALMRTTRTGVFTRVNRTFSRWTGYSSEDLIGVKRLSDLLSAGGRIFHLTHWLPLMQMQGSVSEIKFEVVTRDGETVPMVFNAVVDASGEAEAHEIAAFIARDRDAYERELVEARRRLEESVREASRLEALATDRALLAEQMIGIVSHDLRNPLTTIVMGANLLKGEDLSSHQKSILERMLRAADQSNQLIGDLLDFTQARLAGGLTVSRIPIQIHELIAQTVDGMSLLYPKCEFVVESSGSGQVDADPKRITQLIGNLVSNAATYGAPDAPITICSITDEGTCSIEVHNEGPPIPEELQEIIFSPMKRASSNSASGGNVGLGLFICQQIAQAHGGSAQVTSSHDAGTTFRIEFPIS